MLFRSKLEPSTVDPRRAAVRGVALQVGSARLEAWLEAPPEKIGAYFVEATRDP